MNRHSPVSSIADQKQVAGMHSVVAILAVGLALLLAVTSVSAAAAQSATPQPASVISDDQVNAIAKEMYCPVCENTPLDVCPTQACIEWRELIREMLAEGKTEAEIKEYFVNRFGDRVLAEPPRRGLNWLIYILPPLVMLAGVALLYGAFRSYRKPVTRRVEPGVDPAGGSQPQDEYVRRLEEELRKQ